MDKDLKSKWVEALRSNQYNQGQGYLKVIDAGCTKHCCLGVLAEVAGQKFSEGDSLLTGFRKFGLQRTDPYAVKFGPMCLGLPDYFKDKVGLGEEEESHLIEMNDELEFSFEKIADWIEENL